jgi:hypothetical protein
MSSKVFTRSTGGTRRVARRRCLAVALVVGATSVVTSCSADDQARADYCAAWSELQSAVGATDDLEFSREGVDAAQRYVEGLRSSLDRLLDTGEVQLGDEVDAVGDALAGLGSTLVDGDLPLDRRDEVRSAADELAAAWDQLADAAAFDDCEPVG